MKILMTLKDIAIITGKSVRTVEQWINPKKSSVKITQDSSVKITDRVKRRKQLEKNPLYFKIKKKVEEAKFSKIAATFNLEEVVFIIRLGGNDQLADIYNTNAKDEQERNQLVPQNNSNNLILRILERMDKRDEQQEKFNMNVMAFMKQSMETNQRLLQGQIHEPKQLAKSMRTMTQREEFKHVIDDYLVREKNNGNIINRQDVYNQIAVEIEIENLGINLYEIVRTNQENIILAEIDKMKVWETILPFTKKLLNYFEEEGE